MSDHDPSLEQAFNLIRKAFEKVADEAYARGQASERDRIRGLIASATVIHPPTVTVSPPTAKDRARKRAPKGSVATLIERSLKARGAWGATTAEIMGDRAGEAESLIQISSVRGELRRGAATGKYEENTSGRWFLVRFHDRNSAEGNPPTDPSAEN
ncbi:hypothetical protein NK718_18975 [Alsobacter sp. SYSU M60028]|uniref:Uncharacterized protein n=1 Tax=Alsobacter ponti TaxID=2962936 RepID=A0ABT1LGQ6_9HYPH|nr:hypothetical protein [Alsobacter ponti]MCP8940614.1 hypothetical protein [Alsobacter ponti]